MAATTTTEDELIGLSDAALANTLALLRSVDADLRLRDSDWTARDVAAHLVNVLHRYTARDFRQREGLVDDPSELTGANADGIADHAGATLSDLVDRLAAEAPAWNAIDLAVDDLFPFHAGQNIDGAGARSNWIGELLLHGYDVARAAGRPWDLPDRAMLLILRGALQVAPGWLDTQRAAGVETSVVMRPRGGTPQLLRIADERLVIRDAARGDRPDAVIAGPATAMCLLLYGRIGVLGATRRGLMVAGGRRPWRGVTLTKLFLPI
jgi:uncharacterized protein (TIGR03083 family)